MDTLQNTLESLTSMFHMRMNKFEAELQSKTSAPLNVTGLSGEFSSFRSFILDVLKGLQQQVESLGRSVDKLEMHSRRKILLIHGVAEQQKEDLGQVVVNLFRDKLKMSSFSVSAIKRCQRMGRPVSPHKHRPILVKMQQVSIRNEVWFSKIQLKGSGVTLSEFLTKPRHDLFMASREKFGVSKCWTRDGDIYVIGSNGERHKVSSQIDLQKISQTPKQGPSRVDSQASRIESTKLKRSAAAKK